MQGKMKAVVFYEPLVMKYEEVDIPQIADNEVLVRVKAVGICGSDVSYYYGHSPLDTVDGKGPLFLGHEASGVIAEVGGIPQKLGLFKEGDRVTINPVQQCNACPACMRGEFNTCPNCEVIGVSVNGCFAEYVKVKYTHAYKIPDEVSFESAALSEPLACATHGIFNLDIKLGQTVVVYGLGGIGLMMVQLAKASGAGKVIAIGVRDYGIEKALAVGADYAINVRDKSSKYYTDDTVAKVRALNGGELAPRCIVPTSNMAALQDALNVTGACSTICYFGLPSPEDRLQVDVLGAIQSERTIRFAWLAPLVWDNVSHAVASGQVDLSPIITNKFTLEQTEEGIKYMKESKDDKIKGLVLVD
ncbi:MAG: alcohol dehydrogenase catalytic domain-containing protein [Clostridiales Family XIII bacterium]|jgi:L-iditol 2-dehydrogenase|nr:alcohol dehydrogenase catalytic domain-containing protein [Clostridiales Family XIII bacterium]